MKISELINALQNFKEDHGNLEVYVPDSDYGYFPDIPTLDSVEIEESEDNFVNIDVCSLEIKLTQ